MKTVPDVKRGILSLKRAYRPDDVELDDCAMESSQTPRHQRATTREEEEEEQQQQTIGGSPDSNTESEFTDSDEDSTTQGSPKHSDSKGRSRSTSPCQEEPCSSAVQDFPSTSPRQEEICSGACSSPIAGPSAVPDDVDKEQPSSSPVPDNEEGVEDHPEPGPSGILQNMAHYEDVSCSGPEEEAVVEEVSWGRSHLRFVKNQAREAQSLIKHVNAEFISEVREVFCEKSKKHISKLKERRSIVSQQIAKLKKQKRILDAMLSSLKSEKNEIDDAIHNFKYFINHFPSETIL